MSSLQWNFLTRWCAVLCTSFLFLGLAPAELSDKAAKTQLNQCLFDNRNSLIADSLYPEANVTLRWYSLDQAIDFARSDGKKILIHVYADWCGWCKIMEKKSYSHHRVIEYLNKRYYPVKLNAWTKEDIWFMGYKFSYIPERNVNQLAYQLLEGKLKYPTTVILNNNGEVLSPVQGYLDVANLEKLLFYFGEDYYTKLSWNEYERQYKQLR